MDNSASGPWTIEDGYLPYFGTAKVDSGLYLTPKTLEFAEVTVTGTYTYTGSAQTPTATVKFDGKTLAAGTDYTYAITSVDNTSAGTNAGIVTITVTGIGNYTGTAARIIEAILTMQNSETTSYRSAYQSEIAAHKKQIAKLDLFIENLYEDRVTGVVPESLFKRQIQKYEQDRIDRLQSVETLQKRIGEIKQNTDNAATWARLIKRYTELEVLDSDTLLLLIDKIVVGEAQIINGKRVCDIKIVYNYVGDLDRLALEADGKAVTAYEREAV